MGLVTVVTSGKGGVGKSTLSVSLAVALSKYGSRVLLVDCDAGLRSLDRMTGVEERLLYDISDVATGRCAPADAIYSCERFPGVFVMPAPSGGDDMVEAAVMERLVPVLSDYYDHVILDSPAGIGRGFKAACVAADRALVVCNPDPVCVRSTFVVKNLLDEMGISKQRLIINRFNSSSFKKINTLKDLDAVIDAAGIRLLGVVPEDFDFSSSFVNGTQPPKGCRGMLAVGRIAGRLLGERIPISLK